MPLRPFHNPGTGLEYRLTVALVLAGLALAAVLVIRLLLPWLAIAGLAATGLWLWRRQKARDQFLHQIFYAQLTIHHGHISVLDFAIAAQITGSQARQFLDQRAQEFWGNFEPTAEGDVLYTFPSRPAHPTPVAAAGLSLSGGELAQRLGCTEGEIFLHRSTAPFWAWSRQRDPDGCGWQYDPKGDRFWPVS